MPNEEPAHQPQPDANSSGESLLTGIKGVTAKRLVNSVERVEGLSPEEAEAHERGGLVALRGERRNLHRSLLRASYWFVIVICIVLTIALAASIALYIYKINAEGKIEDLIGGLLTFVFGSVATIAADKFISRKEK